MCQKYLIFCLCHQISSAKSLNSFRWHTKIVFSWPFHKYNMFFNSSLFVITTNKSNQEFIVSCCILYRKYFQSYQIAYDIRSRYQDDTFWLLLSLILKMISFLFIVFRLLDTKLKCIHLHFSISCVIWF